MLYARNLKTEILESLKYSPVVLINGARQTGKSTLSIGLFSKDDRPQYISLDDITILSSARTSPKSFVQNLNERAIIDEIQHAPELLLPIKEVVDSTRKACRFLLTGSANVLNLPKLSESLAGRMEIHTIWPLSQGEIRGKLEAFVDVLFKEESIAHTKGQKPSELLDAMIKGGYPEVVERPNQRARDNWFRGYLTTILDRDVRDLSNIEGITELPNLLMLLATRSGGLLNLADVSRSLNMPYMTLKRYLALLEAVFLVVPIPSWSNNMSKRLVKAPKIFLNDTGLLCHLLGRDSKALETNRTLLGPVFENFILMELVKQITWSQLRPRLYHFRTLDNRYEVDFVLEAPDGRVIGIECKSSSTVTADSFKGMNVLKEQAGAKFTRGVVLYTGSHVVSFGDKLQAVPVQALWEISAGAAPTLFDVDE